jgi:hypothetical protein
VRNKVWLAAAVLALVTPAANADASWTFSGCNAPSGFKICTSAEVSYNAGTGTLFFKVRNLNQSSQAAPSMADYQSATGGWHTITAIGLSNMANHYTVLNQGLNLSVFGTDGVELSPSYWSVGASSLQIQHTGAGTQGHKQGIVGGFDPGPGNAEHMRTVGGDYVLFQLSGFGSFSFNESAVFEWHSQQVAFGDCDVNNWSDRCTDDSIKGTLPPTEVVPEPISMVLLGTGLAGVAAARRRRNQLSKDA